MGKRAATMALAMVATLMMLVGCGKQPSGAYATHYGGGINGANEPGAIAVTVTLHRSGEKVTGRYEGARKGTISGALSGHTLRGTWSEGTADNANGTFAWDFTQDWANFSGTFRSRDGVQVGGWNGQKQ